MPDQNEQYYVEDEQYYENDGQYYSEHQEYSDQNQQPILEEDEGQYPPIYAQDTENNANKDIKENLPWRCQYCTAENQSTDVDCRQCKHSESRF